MILSQSSTRAFSSDAKNTAPGRLELQPWYNVVIPTGSLAATILDGVLDSSSKTKENMPSSMPQRFLSCWLYCRITIRTKVRAHCGHQALTKGIITSQSECVLNLMSGPKDFRRLMWL